VREPAPRRMFDVADGVLHFGEKIDHGIDQLWIAITKTVRR
jgi:hypothetical protein